MRVLQLAKVYGWLYDQSRSNRSYFNVRILSTREEMKNVRAAGLLGAHALLMLFLAPCAAQSFDLTPSPQMICGSHAADLCVPSRAKFIAKHSYILDAQDGDSLDLLSARQHRGSGSLTSSNLNSRGSGSGGQGSNGDKASPNTGGFLSVTSQAFSDFVDNNGCPHPTIPIVPEPNSMPAVGALIIAVIASHTIRSRRTRSTFGPRKRHP